MPHQCTGCGHAFEDGSKEMLGGCPDCSGNKFQFYPAGTDIPDQPPDDDEAPEPPRSEGSAVASKVGRATTKVRDFVSSDPPASDDADGVNAGQVGDASSAGQPDSDPDVGSGVDPDPDAPWPNASDAVDSIHRGGVESGKASDGDPSVSSGDSRDSDIIDADARATERALEEAEDAAQADARTGVVSEFEVEAARPDDEPGVANADDGFLDDDIAAETGPSAADSPSPDADPYPSPAADPSPDDGQVVREPTGEEPDLAELREQLNDQFESIKILEPGQYELNLMELYDRDEYIIALQENGRYVIQMPENFMGDRPAE